MGAAGLIRLTLIDADKQDFLIRNAIAFHGRINKLWRSDVGNWKLDLLLASSFQPLAANLQPLHIKPQRTQFLRQLTTTLEADRG